MDRSIYVIMVPVLLVTVGYVFMLRRFGFAPGYFRLAVAVTVFVGAILWLGRKRAGKDGSTKP
jgi:hypothetical protein